MLQLQKIWGQRRRGKLQMSFARLRSQWSAFAVGIGHRQVTSYVHESRPARKRQSLSGSSSSKRSERFPVDRSSSIFVELLFWYPHLFKGIKRCQDRSPEKPEKSNVDTSDLVTQYVKCLTFHSQEWSISNFPCSLTRNITSHSMNLAFHSAFR